MDILLVKLDANIKGESKVDGYVDQIEVLSFSHSVSQPVTGDPSNQKRTSGRPQHSDFSFTKYLDLSSASILNFCNKGTNLPTVTFVVGQIENGAVNPYWTITLTNALISTYSIGGGGGKPMETITLNYTAVKWDYKLQTDAAGVSGTNSGNWDLAANKAP